MAVRKIIRMGHPNLRKVARPVTPRDIEDPQFSRLLQDMVETLHDYGGIGLAAPQIDVPLRIVIVDIEGGPSRYGELPTVPLTALINPTIEVLNPQPAGHWEGCLSVPGLRGFVERPQHIDVTYTTPERFDAPSTQEFQGFLATVFQHEIDHLDGKLYIDRIADTTKLAYEEELARYFPPDR